ncbi:MULTISPECIES: Stk1 family PASTA domain-containing Ser/Thr kinase [Corynebacterium]|uniref:Stk1 family PASTA domain-containing Ser/Thr kinase n=1 Tax=Corynebacterium TaxID=1716 RepID=UPI0022BA1571|nr:MULTISPECIES: Stk1 family PASTA domain-containing Ser/Thr kinase [Corynebacterium]
MIQLQVGDVLEGRYRIDHPIARGGMSTVYRCVDLRLGRAVAAKVMDERYVADPVFARRFRREARAMAQLSHPNLVGVYDFADHDDIMFLIMELITGGTLRELLAERGPMPPHAAAAVMVPMLTGLAAAHDRGLIHRDIKPDNVLINSDHAVKLADFGLVRSTTSPGRSTQQIIGTVGYLSPEQVNGAEITPASDVYSAGVVLFELLTGTTPFPGGTDLERAYRRLDQPVPAPSELINGVPPVFDDLVTDATSIDPAYRFADATEFLTATTQAAAELRLPAFRVPVPRNSAANRAAAIPTDTTGLPEALAATGIITAERGSEAVTEFLDGTDPDAHTQLVPVPAPVPAPAPAPPAAPTALDFAAPDYSAPEPNPPSELAPAGPPEPAPPARRAPHPPVWSNRSAVTLTAWILVVASVIAAVAIGGWWLGSGRYGDIPQVLGMDTSQATAAVIAAGFTPTTTTRYDNATPKEHVAGIEPAERAVRGSTVEIQVSLGRPVVPEPSLAENADTYLGRLREASLEPQLTPREFSDAVPADHVLSTDPAAGTTVDVGARIAVTVSDGPAPSPVPDVSGLPIEDARAILSAAGFTPASGPAVFDPHQRAGRVSTTDPRPGQPLAHGKTVTLVASTAIEVPDVSGATADDARSRLGAAGLTSTTQDRDPQATGPADQVIRTTPGAGSLVDPAAPNVTIILPGKVRSPALVGSTVGHARQEARAQGFELDADSAPDSARIWAQSTLPGIAYSYGTTINVKTLR